MLFGLPRSGAALDGFAEAARRLERKRPGSIARALERRAMRAARGGSVAHVLAAQPSNGIETRATEERTAQLSDGKGYSRSQEGYHHYRAGPNMVCSAELRCTAEEIKDQMSRFAVPGQPPDQPVQSLHIYAVHDPVVNRFIGYVRTNISHDGLTIQNVTRPGHLLFDGQITRTATRNPDGSWSVTTVGVGNNIYFGMATANELAGPHIFGSMDEQMRRNIERLHGVR